MDIIAKIQETINAKVIGGGEVIQELWSGYGHIVRYRVENYYAPSVVAKHIKFPEQIRHPRGWNSDISHQRKLKSYQVEPSWYAKWALHCNDSCRTPKCLAIIHEGEQSLIILEDLVHAGFPVRKSSATIDEMKLCLSWLANFHGIHLNHEPKGLWQKGTYWHLETRPEELKALKDPLLKDAAHAIDQKLDSGQYKTIVHGDAKLANFCFSTDSKAVAAVDFQYVGGGCGMKDVAYFIGSCILDEECERHVPELIEYYIQALNTSIKNQFLDVNLTALDDEWMELFPIAWADFHRFLKGWSPNHWKIHDYSERITKDVLEKLSTN